MTAVDAARKILDTMLGHLGFSTSIDLEETSDGPCLQIACAEAELLTGKDGERLDDLQYLVNRIVRKHFPDAPRIKVDCGGFRSQQEGRLIEEIQTLAQRVRSGGSPQKLRPLNAYHRRIVHNALLGDPDIESHSPDGDQRYKRITLRLKRGKEPQE